MKNKAFSKISLLIILVVIVGGGYFIWQYFGTQGEEINLTEEVIRRDAVRKLQMRQIVTYQELYYGNNDEYYQSLDYPEVFGWTDPKTNDFYNWVDNTRDNQKFCAYANLENGGFYIVSHLGSKEVAIEPLTISDCDNFAKVESKKDELVMSAEEYMQKAEEELTEFKKFDDALDLEARNHLTKAIDYAKLATDSDPNNSEMWFRLGNIYCGIKDTVQDVEEWCLKSYQKALELDLGNQLYYQKIEELIK